MSMEQKVISNTLTIFVGETAYISTSSQVVNANVVIVTVNNNIVDYNILPQYLLVNNLANAVSTLLNGGGGAGSHFVSNTELYADFAAGFDDGTF